MTKICWLENLKGKDLGSDVIILLECTCDSEFCRIRVRCKCGAT